MEPGARAGVKSPPVPVPSAAPLGEGQKSVSTAVSVFCDSHHGRYHERSVQQIFLSVPSIEVLIFAFLVAFKVSFTPARSFRPFPPLSKVPFLGKRKQSVQCGGRCAPGTLWPCATERAGSGQPTQCAHRSCPETRAVAGNCAKAAQAGFSRRGRPRPRKPRRGFGRRAPKVQRGPRRRPTYSLQGSVPEVPAYVSVRLCMDLGGGGGAQPRALP
jgi:hypothetical protein